MELRIALQSLANRQGLDEAARRQLLRLAGLEGEPAALAHGAPRALAVGAAALVGLGAILWVAAHWDTLGRLGQFALLLAVIVLAGLATWWCAGATRAAWALLAFLATGGLWAFFGQTYQTGADAWQLFALWAVLMLPLALAVRSDVLWAPWALVAMTALALWMRTHTAHRWRFEVQDLTPQLMAWAAALALVAALSAGARRWTGAGPWSLRTAVTLAALVIAGTGLGGLLQTRVGLQYPLALAVLALGLALLASRRAYDIFGLSALTLCLNGLLVAGVARLLLDRRDDTGDPIGQMLLIGLVAAALLAFSVSRILALARRRSAQGLV